MITFTKQEAHDLLTALRAGVPFPMHEINRALVATGDLRRWIAPSQQEEKSE